MYSVKYVAAICMIDMCIGEYCGKDSTLYTLWLFHKLLFICLPFVFCIANLYIYILTAAVAATGNSRC